MKKSIKGILTLFLTAAIAIGLCMPAVAYAPNPVPPSDTLEVGIKTADGTTVLHTYTLDEMNALSHGTDISYSGIDNMPWTVKTVATGVYVRDLINDVQQYVSLDLWSFSKLRVTATDGANGILYSDLFADRYYYPGLHEPGHGLTDGEIVYDVGPGIQVEPMLAVTADQQRLPIPGDDARTYSPERYTLLFGITPEELESVKPRISECKRGICKLVIDMGDVTIPPDTGNVPVEAVALNLKSSTIQVGQTLQLTAEVTPADATVSSVSWSSSNPQIASVSPAGIITALSAGTTVIRATSDDKSQLYAECAVTVTKAAVNVTLNKESLSLGIGDTMLLTASVTGSSTSVTWSSSNEKVALVTEGRVTAVGIGDAIIYADCEGARDACSVHVAKNGVKVGSVTLDRTNAILLKGESLQLQATCYPEDATNTTVFWSSSAPGIASVNTAGTVTAKNSGSAVITATTEDGNFTASCTVTVTLEKTDNYSDISGNWASEEINRMAKLGFISGYADGTFQPAESITRAEIITILVRILQQTRGLSLEAGHTFTDTEGTWAEPYVSTAVVLGITNGYGDDTFGFSDEVSREQIAVMLTRVAAIEPKTYDSTEFSDNGSTSPWAVSAVAQMAGLGIITGYTDGSFQPLHNASRAEAVVMLERFYNFELTGAVS